MPLNRQKFLNTYLDNISMDDAVDTIDACAQQRRKAYVVAVNVDVIVKMEKDSYLQKITNEAELILADGKPLIWISKLQKRPLKEKISGSDLVPQLCRRAAEKGYRLFILGGKPGVAEKAKEKLEWSMPGIQIVGTYAPPLGFERDPAQLEQINAMITDSEADILLACLGCPKQEKFIYKNYLKYMAPVSVCAGATVDFLAGNVSRAPKWMSDHGLEWFYRFLQEPGRLFKRYFVDDVKILKLVWKYRKG